MVRLRGAAGPLLVALVLALSGACAGGDPEPKVAEPTPSDTAEPSGSASVSASPTVQALGPEETVRAWVDARNDALRSGDTAAVDALSAKDCRSCEQLNKVIREIYQAGGSFETRGWRIKTLMEKVGAIPVQVDTALIFARGRTIPAAGADPIDYAQEKHIVTFKLVEETGQLKVRLVLFL